jgi:hypothetical protein
MVNRLFHITLFVLCFSALANSQQANNACASSTNLVSGAAPLCAQTTNLGTTQVFEVVNSATVGATNNFNQTVWYNFVATSSTMFVEWEFTGLVSGATWCPGNVSVVVYNSSTCLPAAGTIIATESAAADGSIVIYLTGLTPGNTYLVQVGYNDGAGCKIPIFCIAVGNTPTQCTCAAPCAAGCGYSTAPSVATVTSTCPEYDLNPVSDGGETHQYCYSFIANNTAISFSMIITSNCGGGNVSALTWTLQTSACGANVATGDLSNMSATCVVGTSYVLCYNYTIPATCHHSSLYPYFVGASPLPVDLLSFTGKNNGENKTVLDWKTATEINCDHFILERSEDGTSYHQIAKVDGAGNSDQENSYEWIDENPIERTVYYRLKQFDTDGKMVEYDPIAVNAISSIEEILVVPNPVGDNATINFNSTVLGEANIEIINVLGQLIISGSVNLVEGGNSIQFNTSAFESGVYFGRIIIGSEIKTIKFTK